MNISASLPSRASNVTAETFTRKAVAFVKANEDEAFIVALRPYPGFPAADKFVPMPRQWGAWMAYWGKIGYKTKAMQERGYATTPAEWPHDFDADATVFSDDLAAEAFEAKWRNERESAAFHAGGIAKGASKAIAMWRQMRPAHKQATPQSHLSPGASPTVDVSDFPDANATHEELRAWDDRNDR